MKLGKRLGHMKIRDLSPVGFISKPTDIMVTRYDLEIQFEVAINYTQTSITYVQQLEEDALVCIVD